MGSRSERALGSTSSGSRGREVTGIVLLGLAIFVGLSVGSLQLGNGTLMGPCGATVGLGVYALVGVGAYLMAIGLGFAALRCLQGEPVRIRSIGFWAALGVGVSFAILIHLGLGAHRLRGHSPGGALGEYTAELLVAFVGRVGAALAGVVLLAVSLTLSTSLSFRAIPTLLARAGQGLVAGLRGSLGILTSTIKLIFPAHDDDEAAAEDDDEEEAKPPKKARAKKDEEDATVADGDADVDEADILPRRRRSTRWRR